MSQNTVPFTKEDIKAYLDRNIKFWREMDRDQNVVAPDYIDAYQSVRVSLFGEALPEDDMQDTRLLTTDAPDSVRTWKCSNCGYLSDLQICTKCRELRRS